ncbi:hypothetical protein D3C72_1280480 [compost metagenome]
MHRAVELIAGHALAARRFAQARAHFGGNGAAKTDVRQLRTIGLRHQLGRIHGAFIVFCQRRHGGRLHGIKRRQFFLDAQGDIFLVRGGHAVLADGPFIADAAQVARLDGKLVLARRHDPARVARQHAQHDRLQEFAEVFRQALHLVRVWRDRVRELRRIDVRVGRRLVVVAFLAVTGAPAFQAAQHRHWHAGQFAIADGAPADTRLDDFQLAHRDAHLGRHARF